MVVDKIRTDGLLPTIAAVRAKLERPIPLGYSSVGTVIEVGDGVDGFAVGDRVASNGQHAEIVCVPTNLSARVPAAVDDETACFTAIGAIALQGLRLVQPTLGETVVVTGVGGVGMLAVQLLRANGCGGGSLGIVAGLAGPQVPQQAVSAVSLRSVRARVHAPTVGMHWRRAL
jgi:NADPH:quinone reductase-like Zn-dependent oxidoreductase